MEVLAVALPEVPVMFTVVNAAGREAAAVKVTTLEPVAGLAPKAAVTPAGRLDAASVTLPVNPPKSDTEMASVLLLPWFSVKGDSAAPSVNPLPPAALQVVPLMAKFVGCALATVFQDALNPTDALLPPAAIAAS